VSHIFCIWHTASQLPRNRKKDQRMTDMLKPVVTAQILEPEGSVNSHVFLFLHQVAPDVLYTEGAREGTYFKSEVAHSFMTQSCIY
jgi:hypothetical protein